MSDPVVKLCVALRDGTEPDAAWVDELVARAGTGVECVPASSLAAVCADADADLVMVTEPVGVPDGWLVALASRPTALAVGTVAAVSVATSDLSTLGRACTGIGRALVADAAPGACVLVTREALQLVSAGDLARDPAAFPTAFAARCAEHGLVNLVGDGAVVAGPEAPAAGSTPAEHARAWARAALRGPSITIDARSLVAGGAGTQVHTLELVRALAARPRLRLRVVLPPPGDTDPDAMRELQGLSGLELVSYDDVVNSGIATDIVHRPYQVFTVHDLRLLQRLGRRIIVTQQDQLLYRNPSYFSSEQEWQEYRQACRIALAWADRTVFFTEHARQEALRDELLEESQAEVVAIGVDRREAAASEQRRPASLESLGERPFLLVLGTDLAHKNRPFAIRLLRALREHHDWDGALVLAGPASEHGSSRAVEAGLLHAGDPVFDPGRVDEAGRRWLLDHCVAVAFPSVEEGFGLMPFEAGQAGVPCLFAPVGAMAETLPREAAVLIPWDVAASAAATAPLLSPGSARDRHVALLREAAGPFTWARTAEALEMLYDDMLVAPSRPVGPVVAAEIERHEEFRARAGEDAMALLGPGGMLPTEMLRPLLAVLSRPPLRRSLFALLGLLYRAGRRSG